MMMIVMWKSRMICGYMWKPGHDDEVNEEDGGGEEGEDADCQDGPVLED